jgi:hypothetical protein
VTAKRLIIRVGVRCTGRRKMLKDKVYMSLDMAAELKENI